MDWQEQARRTEERLHGQFVQALDGDAAAYQRFLQALGGHLRAYFRRRLFQLPDEVEDLVQETLLAIHTHRHTYRRDQPLTAWVHTIARYKLVDLLRARERREKLNDPLDDEAGFFARSDTEAAEARRDLATMLDGLGERQRRALVMTKIEGASVAETAAALGMSEVAVKVGVHRSLKALAARWGGSR
ncbi:sigma-70 family RNA polymerase sigma factor [Ramlibacter rhizophilus]|uniref:Sigma-70 family RNA polymerase sigma factor n=1 Tax=Ramlibacter rhizophilus TaxID=1781167 RepID=A0A4Z0BFS8_9BURK|nr:sigma-70 family RNA polymerase sigma factor [Ramlibacter rhizophilus]TFY97541.1 sigma-70 family RNA polymerase sigma factor [Ramlibacter rhizophilus]